MNHIKYLDLKRSNFNLALGKVVAADVFNPCELSTDQWVKAAKSFGAKYIIFTIDHFSGFLMWPSKTDYKYSVKYTKWREGKGDVLLDFIKSSKKYGLEHGVFYSVHNNKSVNFEISKIWKFVQSSYRLKNSASKSLRIL